MSTKITELNLTKQPAVQSTEPMDKKIDELQQAIALMDTISRQLESAKAHDQV